MQFDSYSINSVIKEIISSVLSIAFVTLLGRNYFSVCDYLSNSINERNWLLIVIKTFDVVSFVRTYLKIVALVTCVMLGYLNICIFVSLWKLVSLNLATIFIWSSKSICNYLLGNSFAKKYLQIFSQSHWLRMQTN